MVLWCITATSAVIRNTLLEAGGDSSKQLFFPFTFMGNFVYWNISNSQKNYSLSLDESLHSPSQADLIICFFDQAINEPRNNVHI